MRYEFRPEIENESKFYSNKLKSLGVKRLVHFETPRFTKITDEQRQSIDVKTIYWKINTKFYKLAHDHYGDAKLWWIIAFFNNKPTDSHAKIGDIIFIPINWEPVYTAITQQSEV